MNNPKRKSVNLAALLNQRNSIQVQQCFDEWTCQDCSIGHLILMVATIILTYLIQVSGFILALIFSTPNDISTYKSAALTQPYTETVQILVIAFLVHFQFLTLYLEPFNTLMLISKELQYTNITLTLIMSAILFSNINYADKFVETFHVNALSVLILLTCYTYAKLYKLAGKGRMSQTLGFNVLYSVMLPFLCIEFGETAIRVASFYGELAMSVSDRVVFFACFYFVIGFVAVGWLRDVYMGLGCGFNLFGIFVVQAYNVCEVYSKYCKVEAWVVPMVFAMGMVAETGFVMYKYPQAYCYRYYKKRF